MGRELLIEGFTCWEGDCFAYDIEEQPLEDTARLWSNPDDWPSGAIPVEGDDVVIESGWNMYLDIAETPLLNSLEINGRLSFRDEDGLDITLNSYLIWVHAGELFVGTEDAEFRNKAIIRLHGQNDSPTWAFTNYPEVGNKILVNTGTIAMYGTTRYNILPRLLLPVYAGDDECYLEPGLDIVEGDYLYFGPTALQHDHGEYLTVLTHNQDTGHTTFTTEFEYYHFGDYDTEDNFSGLDMRGEVAILTQNVVIEGTDDDGWGGQVLTTGIFETSGHFRDGNTTLWNVEIYNCS